MGQYYIAVNVDRNIAVEHSFKFIGGMKLTEHSYVNNALAVYLRQKLANEWKGNRIIHLGDYANANDGTPTAPVIAKLLEEGALQKDEEYPDTIDNEIFDSVEITERYDKCDYRNYRYVANIDKKVYYDLNDVIPCSLWGEASLEIGVGKIGFMAFDPLLLLVACGNGQGGGDYYDSYNDFDKIGSWAGDHLMATNDINELVDYEKVVYRFSEEKVAKNLDSYFKKLVKKIDFYKVSKEEEDKKFYEAITLGKAQDCEFILEMMPTYSNQIATVLNANNIKTVSR